MMYRVLGRTGVRVSVVSFGAGPVSGLMTGTDAGAQRATIGRAIEAGVNWFDTAAGYGQGQSEANLGRVLADLLWRRTVVSQEWLAEKLAMKSAANVSQQLRRLDVNEALKQVPEELKRFLEEADATKP